MGWRSAFGENRITWFDGHQWRVLVSGSLYRAGRVGHWLIVGGLVASIPGYGLAMGAEERFGQRPSRAIVVAFFVR